MKRYTVTREGNGWRVTDTRKGTFASARIHDRRRAVQQAATLNRKLDHEEDA